LSRPAGSAGSTGTADRPPSRSVPPATPSGAPAPTPTLALFPARTSTVVATSGLCLDDGNNRTTEGNPVKVFSCNGTTAQVWTFGADATIRVHNMCLHPEPASPSPGALLATYTCGANAFETWRPGPAGSIVNVGSQLCLTDPTGTGTTDRVSLRACDGGARQHWA
jgi:beta-glucosidase